MHRPPSNGLIFSIGLKLEAMEPSDGYSEPNQQNSPHGDSRDFAGPIVSLTFQEHCGVILDVPELRQRGDTIITCEMKPPPLRGGDHAVCGGRNSPPAQ